MALPYLPALIFTAAGMAIPLWNLTFAQSQLQDNTAGDEMPGTRPQLLNVPTGNRLLGPPLERRFQKT